MCKDLKEKEETNKKTEKTEKTNYKIQPLYLDSKAFNVHIIH